MMKKVLSLFLLLSFVSLAQTYSFDPGDDGSGFTYDRFAKSPCFGKLGFSPYRNRVQLDKEYCDCERKYLWRKVADVSLIVFIVGAVGYMIWLSRGGKVKFKSIRVGSLNFASSSVFKSVGDIVNRDAFAFVLMGLIFIATIIYILTL